MANRPFRSAGEKPEAKPAEIKPERPQGYWRLQAQLPNLDKKLLAELEAFYSVLIKFNSTVNLISRKSELDADMTHIADGVLGSQIILESTKSKTIHDIGSGNGVPGMVLALMAPNREVVLVDSDERKCEFLKFAISQLKLANVKVMRARIDELKDNSIICAVSRGLASISKTLLLMRKSMSINGEFYHFKGSSWAREVGDIPSQICSYWEPKLVKEYELPIIRTRMAIVITKKLQ